METRFSSVQGIAGRPFMTTMLLMGLLLCMNDVANAAPRDWQDHVQAGQLSSWNFFGQEGDDDMATGRTDAQMALSCLPEVNISLGQGGFAILTSLTLVNAPAYPPHFYEVDIMGPLTNTVYCEQIGQTLMVTVTEIPTGNACMSSIYVEDKLKPTFTCAPDTVPCTVDIFSLDFEEFLEGAFDNCDEDLSLWSSFTIQNLPCNPHHLTQKVTVTWTATDDSGNSATCQDILYLKKPAPGQVVFPPNISISCVNANTDPSNTGVPTFNGEPLDHTCQYIVFKNDQVVPMCNGAQKIIRLWTVKDWCTSAQISMPQEILIVDDTPPTITCPANITINTSANACTTKYTLPQPIVSDLCADPAQIDVDITIAGIPGIFSPGQMINLGIGTTLITMRATDPCGNSSMCQYSVTVRDNTPPIPTCHPIVVTLGADGMAFIYADALDFNVVEACGILSKQVWRTTNLCGVPSDLVPGPEVKFCCADIGTTVMVGFKVTDLSGNMNTCMFQVTVMDKTPPLVECRDITVSVTGQGDIIITPQQVEESSSDNCQIVTREVTPDTFDCSDIGEHIVTLTVTDQSGNTATCTATVTIIDEIPPVAECQDLTVTVDENGLVTITTGQIDAGSSDNCAIDTMFLDQYEFDCEDEGENLVTLTVVDFSGNEDQCTATVTVLTSPPVAECQNITVSLDANGQVTITADQIDDGSTDDCGIDTMTVTPSTFDCEDIGVVIVTLTVTDISGNTATCTASVTIQDNMPPTAICQDITVMLDANGNAVITAAQINDGSFDNCEIISITVTPTSFTCEDVGNNIVTLTVTDQSGNTSTCTATVMVEMPDPPVAQCQDITVTLNQDGVVEIDPLDINNGSSTQCGDLTFTVTPDTMTCEDVGEINIVVLTVTDETGSTATCTAQVTVNENPPVAICQNITVSLDANGEVSITALQVNNNSTDDCGIISYVVTPDDFDCTDLGPNIVTLTVTDGSGFTSTCTATVTVEDNTPPTAICQDITVALDGNGMATITAAQINNGSSDNCDNFTLSADPTSFTCEDVGPNIVTLTVTDQSGNTSTCTATVTVVAEPPVAQCQDITVSLDANGIVVITPEQVDAGSGSNCGNLDLELDEDTFDCTELGPNIVTLTVTDMNGNESTCTATVTVVDDDAPLCSAQDLTVFVNAAGQASIDASQINDGSDDNCFIDTITVTPTDFDCSDLGPNVVTLTVTDQSGNSSTCTATVTVVDTISPVCEAIDITVSINGNGMVTITASQVDGGSTDNCGPPNLSVTPNTFDCEDLGPNVVVLTVTDASGNSSTCTATVTVGDNGMLEANCQNVTILLDANGNASVDPEQVNNGSGGGCDPGMLEFDLSQTDFTCANLGPNLVVLTVTDEDGNTATCTAIITVVDLIPPQITCPPNVTVDCHTVTNPDNTSQFGNATATDNCPGTIITETHVINLNDCHVGTIVRTFTATDASGNTATCVQVVTITNPNPLNEDDITWPPSPVSVNICNSTDPEDIPNGFPVIDPTALLCADVEITWNDVTQMFVDNNPNTPCKVITRTWTIEDACQPNGTFTFVQIINVQDMVGPVFTNINDMTKVANANCVAFFTLIASATDCAGVSITNNSPYGANTGANASGNYPIGVTTVIFTATDGCGNTTTMDVVITVTDPDPTEFLCEKVIFILPEELEIAINAHDFITFIEGNCTNEDDFIISYSSTNPFDTVRIFDCGDVGVQTFPLWFWNATGTMKVDSCNNADLDLRDPLDLCGDGLVLGGEVENEDGLAIEGVEVAIMNAPMTPDTTNAAGEFALVGLNEATGYEVAPHQDRNHREGVSTLDLVLIQKHLLGISKLSSPYKMIAADANRSGHITAIDLIEIRKVILGINMRFPHTTSWRFVDKAYQFPNPYNPFVPGFPESVWIDSVAPGDDRVDFIGVKTGDVNGSFFNAKSPDEPIEIRGSVAVYKINVQPDISSDGQIRAWNLVASSGQGQLLGLQFGIEVGPLTPDQVKGISSEVLSQDQWSYNPLSGQILISWAVGLGEDIAGRRLLSIPVASGQAQSWRLTRELLDAEAYQEEAEIMAIRPVKLNIQEAPAPTSEEYHLYQNIPNPFNESTLIRFSLPADEMVRFVIHDMTGRQVYIRELQGHAGTNELQIRYQDLGTSGIYYYTLYTLNTSFSRKMSVTKE